MALYLFSEPSFRPSRLLDQHFGLGLDPEDLLAPLAITPFHHHHHHRHNHLPLLRSSSYCRPWRVQNSDSGSTVQCDKDKFQVNLDVQQFAPEELTVKVVDNSVVIEGKHEEKQDEHGFISRQFQRRYVLPDGHDINKVETKLSSDGVLTITAPKMEAIENKEKTITITQTGQPHRPVKQNEAVEEAKK